MKYLDPLPIAIQAVQILTWFQTRFNFNLIARIIFHLVQINLIILTTEQRNIIIVANKLATNMLVTY